MLDDSEVLPNLLADRAIATPEVIFMEHVDGSSLTYSELDQNVLRWAGALSAQGIGSGDTILVMLENRFESTFSWLSVARLGGIEVQINTAYLGAILTHVVNNSKASLAIIESKFAAHFAEIASDLEYLETVVIIDDCHVEVPFTVLSVESFLSKPSLAPLLLRPSGHDISCILYTSGTTGPSKGVIIPWAHAQASATGCIPLDELGPQDAWYSPFPMFHMSGKLAFYASAIFGGRFVLRDSFKTDEFWNDIRDFNCSCTMLIGSTPAFVWNLPANEGDRTHPLRNVLMAPTPDEPTAFMERFNFRIATVFNMTEISCPIMSGWELGPKGSAGRLRTGYEVRIVDEHDREVPRGSLGEIIVRSDEPWVLMAGYWRNPEATANAWRNGWFHTGDAGMHDKDENFYFVDRMKDAIRHRGENISSMELESVINDAPHVLESAAIGVPSEFGEEDIKVYVVPNSDVFSPLMLMEYLTTRIPRFMVPRYVVTVSSLPKTPTEKVRKQELRNLADNDQVWDSKAEGFVIPR
ncbi:MAG: AMP-binding protein [Acidimicrobiales bacterium]|nr:AMP-binding protein [Acidimicrobiales bacterium]